MHQAIFVVEFPFGEVYFAGPLAFHRVTCSMFERLESFEFLPPTCSAKYVSERGGGGIAMADV